MASENDILIVLQEAVRTALYEAANEEIKKLRERFENEMQRTKREMVGKIVNQIQIAASYRLFTVKYNISIPTVCCGSNKLLCMKSTPPSEMNGANINRLSFGTK